MKRSAQNSEYVSSEPVNNVFDFSMEFRGRKVSFKRFVLRLLLFLYLSIYLLWNLYPRDPYLPLYRALRIEVEITALTQEAYEAKALETVKENVPLSPILKDDICVFPKKTILDEFQLDLKVGDRIALYYSAHNDKILYSKERTQMLESIAFFKL